MRGFLVADGQTRLRSALSCLHDVGRISNETAHCFWKRVAKGSLLMSTLSSCHSAGSNSRRTIAQPFQESFSPIQCCPKRLMSDEATVC